MKKTIFVRQLPDNIQNSIKRKLNALQLSKEDIERGMNSRLCDLEDTISIKEYL